MTKAQCTILASISLLQTNFGAQQQPQRQLGNYLLCTLVAAVCVTVQQHDFLDMQAVTEALNFFFFLSMFDILVCVNPTKTRSKNIAEKP